MVKRDWRSLILKSLLIGGILFGLGYVISLIPVKIYDDWYIYRGAAQAILNGDALYQNEFLFSYYYNPPWLALLLIPFSLFNFNLGAGLMVVASLTAMLAVCHRLELNLFKTGMVVGSPLLFYVLIHGQVDAIVLAGILLPVSFWPVVAITKPQVGLALGLEAIKKEHFKNAVLVSGGILLVSFVWFGFWPLAIINSPAPVNGPHNLWLKVWPRQFPVGLAIIFLWINRGKEDVRWLLAASPLLMPYASAGSFLGLWAALHTELKNWQAAGIFITAWAITILPFLL